MKCKKCGEDINLIICGAPNDICWGCLSDEERETTMNKAFEQLDKMDGYINLLNKGLENKRQN
jgi:hypothetical protein